MKILILGSEGFIGSHCIDHFINRNDSVYGVDLYEQPSQQYHYIKIPRAFQDFEEIFDYQFDAVINCAGSGNVPYSMTHPLADFESNCLDTIKILEAIRRLSPQCKYIHLSSAAVYGNPEHLPVTEDDNTNPLSPYGWHKLIAEKLCREYAEIFDLHIGIVRPFSVYGPGLKKQMFWDLYQKAKTSSGMVELLGTGRESRDYIYIKDLVEALDIIIQKGALKGEIYNIASGKEITIAEVVKAFFTGLNFPVKYIYTGEIRKGDPLNWRADISKLINLGFSCNYSIDKGLGELREWLQKN